MRDFSVFRATFWTGETGRKIRAMSDDAIIVATYLITAPNSNMIGLYYVSLPTIAHESGRSLEGALKALRRLSEGGFCHYDEATEIVWIPEMAKHQVGEGLSPSDNRVKAVHKQAMEYRKSRFFDAFVEKYWTVFSLPGQRPKSSPSQAPSDPLRSQDQGQGHYQEQELPIGSADANGATPDIHEPTSVETDTAWTASKTSEVGGIDERIGSPKCYRCQNLITTVNGNCTHCNPGKPSPDGALFNLPPVTEPKAKPPRKLSMAPVHVAQRAYEALYVDLYGIQTKLDGDGSIVFAGAFKTWGATQLMDALRGLAGDPYGAKLPIISTLAKAHIEKGLLNLKAPVAKNDRVEPRGAAYQRAVPPSMEIPS